MRRVFLLLILALPLHADALTDLRTALGKLTAREPVRATYEVQRVVNNAGKFDDDKFTGKAAIDIEGDGAGVRLIYSRPLLDQIARELEARSRDPKLSVPTIDAIAQMGPLVASDALNAVPSLLNLLIDAQLVEDRTGTLQGKPARVVILKLANKSYSKAGKVTMLENKLTLWLNSENVPLAAEQVRDVKFSILFFKGQQKMKQSWHYAQVGDRLVRVRLELSEVSSGMGQNGNESTVATLRVHG